MVSKNGATEIKMLSEAQTAKLQEMMQPLVLEWKLAQATITGFLACAGITNSRFNIDMNTGIVSLVEVQQAVPLSEPEMVAEPLGS